MMRVFKRVSKTAGLIPGTLVHVGEKRTDPVKIRVIDYDEKGLQEKEVSSVEDCYSFRDTNTVSWINIDGIHDLEIIRKLGDHFALHPIILEDIVNTGQRPKLDDGEKYLYIVLKMLSYEESKGIVIEQVSLILGPNYVISFQEQVGDVFDAIRERIRSAKGRIRKSGADYLAYSLIDAIVDNYFLIIERLGDRVEAIEEKLLTDSTPHTLQTIHTLKRDIIFLRKSVWPLRDVVNTLERGESPLIKKPTRIFLRDVYDHTFQVIDTIETSRDVLSGMHDTYLSSVSNRMNEVMKVLTIIATLFIPLTFIAGIYGMNFKHMPELDWPWAYAGVWAVMLTVGIAMVCFFKRKGWL